MSKEKQLGSRAVHAGRVQVPDTTRPVSMPIYQTSVYAVPGLDVLQAMNAGEERGYIYARNAQPNADALAEAYAELEGGEAGLAAASGMGAIFAVLFSMLEPGAHVVADRNLYGITVALFEEQLSRYGVVTTYVDTSDPAALEAAIRPETRLIYTESISNPLVQVANLPRIAAVCRERRLKLVVDNTFASPVVLRPLEHGADAVISSATKFLGGHSDLTAGVAAGASDLIAKARRTLVVGGAMLDPFAAWLALRGIKTLHLRVERQCANALALAIFLAQHPRVERVYYPGLEDHPLLAKGAGAMLSFAVRGGLEEANRLVRNLAMVELVPSLGDVGTTISHPVLTSHVAMSPGQRAALGIFDNLLRVSVGTEAAEDILGDFAQALGALG